MSKVGRHITSRLVVVCEIEDLDMAVQGSGSSRRIAEQEAAKSVLLSLDILT